MVVGWVLEREVYVVWAGLVVMGCDGMGWDCRPVEVLLVCIYKFTASMAVCRRRTTQASSRYR